MGSLNDRVAWTVSGAFTMACVAAWQIDYSNVSPLPADGVLVTLALVCGGGAVTTMIGYGERAFESVAGKFGAAVGIATIAGGSLLFHMGAKSEREYLEQRSDNALESVQQNVAVAEAPLLKNIPL